MLRIHLSATGAILALDDRGGQAFNASLVPEGRFAAVAANIGPGPVGLLQFETDAKGGIGSFRFMDADNGQEYRFTRRP